MRFMVIVKATKDSEAGKMPSEEHARPRWRKFNEEMVKAGVMLDGDGLQSSSKGARIRFAGGKRTVIDGPFAETKELVAGYWIIQVKSKDEAIEWMKRCPNPTMRTARSRSASSSSSRTSATATRSSITASWGRNSQNKSRMEADPRDGYAISSAHPGERHDCRDCHVSTAEATSLVEITKTFQATAPKYQGMAGTGAEEIIGLSQDGHRAGGIYLWIRGRTPIGSIPRTGRSSSRASMASRRRSNSCIRPSWWIIATAPSASRRERQPTCRCRYGASTASPFRLTATAPARTRVSNPLGVGGMALHAVARDPHVSKDVRAGWRCARHR